MEVPRDVLPAASVISTSPLSLARSGSDHDNILIMTLTEAYARQVFDSAEVGDWPTFMDSVREDVSWTVVNPGPIKSFPVAGVYDVSFAAYTPINNCFEKPLSLKVQNLMIAGDTAIVELRAQGVGVKNGAYFDNFYCWILEFESDVSEPKVKVARAYLDSAQVKAVMEGNL
ncbi:hypothetical protein IAR55_001269 [Kwoniella newhampshirensis]|uniref:SnoaL-like domain-containing protein n=1 Tax=Kwoniella newhampshirensis TaxID=1651941 RepID=A0AAW0Z5F0_9TREE